MSTVELSVVSQSFGHRNAKRRAHVSVSRVAPVAAVKAQRASWLIHLSDWLMQSRIDWATGGRDLPRA